MKGVEELGVGSRSRSERNVVVGQFADRLSHRLHVIAAGVRAGRDWALYPGAPASAAAAEQDDAVASDFSGVLVVAVLVLPLARLETSLDVDLLPFGQVLG